MQSRGQSLPLNTTLYSHQLKAFRSNTSVHNMHNWRKKKLFFVNSTRNIPFCQLHLFIETQNFYFWPSSVLIKLTYRIHWLTQCVRIIALSQKSKQIMFGSNLKHLPVFKALHGDDPSVEHLPCVDIPQVQSGTTPCFKAPQVGFTSRLIEKWVKNSGPQVGSTSRTISSPIRNNSLFLGLHELIEKWVKDSCPRFASMSGVHK